MKKILLTILLFLFFSSFFIFFVFNEIYSPQNPKEKEGKVFSIKKGDSDFFIAQKLENEGIVKSRFYFLLYLVLLGKHKNLKGGEYLISPSMTIPEIVEKLSSGEIIFEKITIVEGWNREEIARYLEEKGILSSEEFLEKTKTERWFQEYNFLKGVKSENLEGFLFPDTYFLRRKERAEEIIRKILNNFDKKITKEIREEIGKKGKTLYEILTMASLLEKEVKTKEEKEMVAGILWKRLNHKMLLQVDATINYITGKKTTKISIDETKIDNPYNTYRYLGLPPGPICNPGLDSILAALYPKESEYWYYLSTPEGKTVFSKTLAEHNIAKARYLK